MSDPSAADPTGDAAERVRALLDRAEAIVDERPDEARAMIVEAAQLAQSSGLDEAAPRASELMGRVALATDADDLARVALAAARNLYAATGDAIGAARAHAALEFLDGPRGFDGDSDAMAAEVALVRALLDHHRAGATPE